MNKIAHDLLARIRRRKERPPVRFMASVDEQDALARQHQTDMGRLFFEHRGRPIQKWLSYLPVYERYFSPFRDRPVRFLEIGVAQGGSLELWRKYLGRDATIFGIDIDPASQDVASPPNQVRLGSQADSGFLRAVVEEMGGLDIVLDDGSHLGPHQRASFETLFPLMPFGSVYLIEDLQAAYWPGFEGGYQKPGTGIEYVKQLIDDMHAWYHDGGALTAAKEQVGALHVYDGIVVIEKADRGEPRQMRLG